MNKHVDINELLTNQIIIKLNQYSVMLTFQCLALIRCIRIFLYIYTLNICF